MGYESWENVWGIWNQLTPRDAEALRRIAMIERAMADLLVSPDWQPHFPTLQAGSGVYASRFPGKGRTLWLLVNRSGKDVPGEQLQRAGAAGDAVLRSLARRRSCAAGRGETATLSFPDRETRLRARSWPSMARSSPRGSPRRTCCRAWPCKRAEDPPGRPFGPVEAACRRRSSTFRPTAPAEQAPEGMVLHRRRQVSASRSPAWRSKAATVRASTSSTPGRTCRGGITTGRLDIPAFYIDKYPVTNAQFKRFLDASGYEPKDDHNFLKDWREGTYPAGWDRKPVTWVAHGGRPGLCRLGRQATAARMGVAVRGPGRRRPARILGATEPDAAALPKPEARPRAASARPTSTPSPRAPVPSGVMDLVGNVWQWTDEYVDEHTRAAVLRGGSYYRPERLDVVLPARTRGWTSTPSICSSGPRKTARR